MKHDRKKDKAAIKKWVAELYSKFKNNDLDGLLSLLSDEVVVMPPNLTSLKGKEECRSLLQPWFKKYTMTNEIVDLEITIDSELAYARVEYQDSYWNKEGGEVHRLDNKAIWLLKRQPNDEWKGITGIYNRNQ
ncbi:DUF4440 domain-containing protein [Candidatus Bathyarchaeota archaeon]|nr:DUF4440 domain-containing protein [Candidatus Bathyarchaeota archaeon]